jgi:hypothetical protein
MSYVPEKEFCPTRVSDDKNDMTSIELGDIRYERSVTLD